MKYCKQCLQTDTLPGILFHDDGVCAACRFQKESIDWNEREVKLQKIAEQAKQDSHGFDCIVGVSGGKDSFFQAFYARDRLGLNTLLVNCAPDNITEVGQLNLETLVQHGFDMISFRPNPRVVRATMRHAFFKYGNPVKPTEYPLFAVSFQTALKFEIPLLILGENIATVVGVAGLLEPNDDAINIRRHNTLGGGNANDWIQEGIELKDLLFYQFPDESELRKKVRAVWLGYYAKEWSYSYNTKFAVEHGLQGRPNHDPNQTGRLNKYYALDDDTQIVNQMLKYYKFGIGLVTGEVCNWIREGRMSREEAVKLVERYDGKCGNRYIQEFCEYIGISKNIFWEVVEKFVNKDLFYKDSSRWLPKFKVGYGLV